MGLRSFLSSVVLASGVAAQLATFTNSDHSLSIHIPSDSASSKSGPIYFQITAPQGTTWTGFGTGSQMAGASMYVVYAGESNVTVSPRAGKGEIMPLFDSSVQITMLAGSGISGDGSMIANFQCDNCISNIDATSTSSSWIFAYRSGSALNSNSQSATIQKHDEHVNFSLDLTSGTGTDNPILAASSSNSGSPTASGTSGVSTPLASSNPNTQTGTDSSSDSDSSDTTGLVYAHGIIMSLLFLGLFPFIALTLYLPTDKRVRYIHGPLQTLSVILLIVGMALGITWGRQIEEVDGYHQIIGYVVVALLVLVQPALGVYQHLHYRKTHQRSALGIGHTWLGRAVIILGIINGGLGWNLTEVTSAYIPYGVIAGIVFVIYVAVVLVGTFVLNKRSQRTDSPEKVRIAPKSTEYSNSP